MDKNKIKELREQRMKDHEALKTLLDTAITEGRDLSAEEKATEERLNAALTESGRVVQAAEERLATRDAAEQRQADAERAFEAILGRPEEREMGGGAGGEKPNDPDQQLRDWLTGRSGKRDLEIRAGKGARTMAELRVLSKLSAGAGANTVKTSFYEKLMAHLIEVSGIMQSNPTVLNTSTGEQILVPKTTAHSTAALVAEAGTIGASDPAFGQVPLDAYKYAVLLQVSHELANDTSVDLSGYLSMQAGRAVGNAFGVHAVAGTGSSQPNGALTAATLGVTGGTGVVGAFTADNLIDLFYSVIAPYRNSPSCGWLMRDATVANVRKLKDSTGQYLWQPSIQIGVPDILLGKPLNTDPNMPAVALSAKSVLFGDFSQYFVRKVEALRFERSDDFAFNTDLITYRCILRADGDLVDTTGALKYFAGGAS